MKLLLSPDAPGGAPAAPSPSAPTTGTAKPAAAPSAGTPPASTAAGDGGAFDDAFGELDKLETASADRDSGKSRAKPPEAVVPPKPDEKPADKPVPAPVEDKPPVKVADLRKAYDEIKPKLKETQTALETANARIKELEAVKPEDTTPLKSQLDAIQKENAALREEMRFVDYQKHPEFIQKYQQPYQEAWGKALHEVTQLNVTLPDGETRKGTDADLMTLLSADLSDLDQMAEDKFGRSAARVIRHVERVRELADNQQKALDDARKTGGERYQQQQEQRKQAEAKMSSVFKGKITELETKYPKWFAADPADPEATKLLETGKAYVDAIFNGSGQLTPEQRAERTAIMRSKAVAFDRLAHRLKTVHAELAAAKKALAEFEASAPIGGADDPNRRGSGKDFIGEANAELDAIEAKSR